jgi:hypothetical protein
MPSANISTDGDSDHPWTAEPTGSRDTATLADAKGPMRTVVGIGCEGQRLASLSSHVPTTEDQNSGCGRKPSDSYSR